MENNKLESTSVEFGYGNQQVKIETNKIARQATAAVVVTIGNLVVLTTVVAKKEADPGKDFFPLAVFYQEKFYSTGRIPGCFVKREARQIIIWKDNKKNFSEFSKMIKINRQGSLNQGGRFIQISSPCNKRIATKEICHIYHELFGDKFYQSIIAIGDNKNDRDMLNLAKYSCVIKNEYSAPIKLNYLKKNVFYSQTDAPLGWEESLKHLNKKLNGKIYQ